MHTPEKIVARGKPTEITGDGIEAANLWGDHADMGHHFSRDTPKPALSTDVECDLVVPSSTSTVNDSHKEPIVPKTDKRDIAGGTGERTSPDILSDFFANANAVVQSRPFNDPVLSLNMPNYEPQRWSFFRNLAKDEFPSRNNDQGLAKIDEGVYTLAGASNDSINMKGLNPNSDFEAEKKPEPVITVADISSMVPAYTPSYIDHRPVMERSAEVFQVDNPYAPMGDDTSPPVPEFEVCMFNKSPLSLCRRGVL
jgi:hypothetical protein